MRLSIFWKINLFLLSMIASFVVLLTVLSILFQKAAMEDDLLQNQLAFAEISAPTIYNRYLTYYTHPTNEEFQTFRSLITEDIKRNKDLTRIVLVGVNSKILFDSVELEKGKYNGPDRYVNDKELKSALNLEKTTYRKKTDKGETHLEIIVPIREVFGGHMVSGWYVVSYTRINSRINETYHTAIITGIFILAISSIFVFFFTGTITRPIKKFTDIIYEISKGKLDSEVPREIINKNDEIGDLAKAFDRILVSLKLAVKKIGLTKEELKIGNLIKEKEEMKKNIEIKDDFIKSIISDADIKIIAFDEKGELLIVNRKMLDETGYSEEDFGSIDSWTKCIFPSKEQKERFESTLSDFEKEKSTEDFIIPVTSKNKETALCMGRIFPIKDKIGQRIGKAIFLRSMNEILNRAKELKNWSAIGFVKTSKNDKKNKKS